MSLNSKQNKIISVVTAVIMLFTVVLLPVMSVFALEDDGWAIQLSREGDANGAKFDYSGYDWSSLGKNLVPDPTVSHFDVDGKYGRYAKLGADGNPVDINTYYWWDKPANTHDGFVLYYKDLQEHSMLDLNSLEKDSNGNYILEPGKSYGNPPRHGDGRYWSGDNRYSPIIRSVLNSTNCLQKDYSLTDDGSGSLRYSSSGGTRGITLPVLAEKKYYVIKFNMQCTLPMESSVGLCLEFNDNGDAKLGVPDTDINLGTQFANKTVDTVCFMTYTGSQKYSEPFIYMYCVSNANVYLDDFGVYEVSEDFASKCADGAPLPGAGESGGSGESGGDETTSAFQVARTSDDKAIDYSDYDWAALGENLIPDPTVNNFDIDGEYGRYAKFDSGHNPVEINPHYWWDKYNDTEYGFKKYISDLINSGDINLSSLTQDQNGYYELAPGYNYGKPSGALTFNVAMRSPLNWNAVKKSTDYASLTDDGTGVLRFSSTGAWRAIPLPKMEKQKYYVIKFHMQSADSKNGSLELCLQYVSGNSDLGVNAAAVVLGSGLACGKTDTVCFVVRTGPMQYIDPFIKFYCQTETFFDDFGMYEVTKEFADSCTAFEKLPEVEQELSKTPDIGQTVYDGEGSVNDYKNLKWGLLGADLLRETENGKISESTQDGKEVRYDLPELSEYAYYCVRMKAVFSAVNATDDFDVYDGDELIKNQLFDMSKLGTENYITFIIYTGSKGYKTPFIKFWLDAGNSVSLNEFAVYKLKPSYAKMCLAENKLLPLSIVNTAPVAAATEPIEGYDFDSEGNLMGDGSFEENANAEETGDAVFGLKALKVTAPVSFDFQTDTASYYMVSVWLKSENAGSAKLAISPAGDTVSIASANGALSSQWSKVSMIFYSSSVTDYTLTLSSDVVFFADGLAVVPLADAVSLACYALDSYVDGTYDPDRLGSAAGVFGMDSSKYSTLVSPYLTAGGTPVTYREAYLKYYDLCAELSNVLEGYSPYGFGSRDNFKQFTAKDENNIIADGYFDDESYWKGPDTVGSENVAITSEYSMSGTALKFTGSKNDEGKAVVYKKRITGLKTNTYYYLRINGMGLGEVISDADFGFMDTTYGLELRNPVERADDATYVNTYHQRSNFKCQDGTWYTRVYMFNTEKNTELDFFIRGTTGTVYYDDIKVFEQSKAYTISEGKISDMSVLSYAEEKFACDDKNNLIPNGKFTKGTEFWGNFRGMNKFVEVVESEGNKMLHFKGNNMAYYYLPWVDVKADVVYTFSYWKKNLNGEKSRSLVVSESNPHGYASEVYSVSEKYGEWELVSVKFVSHNANRVALGVLSLDGEAVFDNVRLFKSSDGYSVSKAEDMPVGGNTFKSTLLGTDGVTKVEKATEETQPVKENFTDDFSDDEDDIILDEEEPEDEILETITTKRRKKIIRGGYDYTWIVVTASVAGGAAILGGGAFLIIALKKKKRKK